MKLNILHFTIIISSLLPLYTTEGDEPFPDDISRLINLDFNYFEKAYPLPNAIFRGKKGETYFSHFSGQVLLIGFLSESDPFNQRLIDSLRELELIYKEESFSIILFTQDNSFYTDHYSRAREKLGVMVYPTFFVVDHEMGIRGSCEGIYPDFTGEDFLKVIDQLLLDIKTPGIINTLQ